MNAATRALYFVCAVGLVVVALDHVPRRPEVEQGETA